MSNNCGTLIRWQNGNSQSDLGPHCLLNNILTGLASLTDKDHFTWWCTVDRGKADARNILGVIIERDANNMYTIGSKAGMLTLLLSN